MIASCSFDCNVYVWGRDEKDEKTEKKGSLVLGNRAPPEKKKKEKKPQEEKKGEKSS